MEKVSIAKSHLISKQISIHGLNPEYQSEFRDYLIHYIIENYTREAGVRDLERHIAALCRFIVIESSFTSKKQELKQDLIEKVLGVIL